MRVRVLLAGSCMQVCGTVNIAIEARPKEKRTNKHTDAIAVGGRDCTGDPGPRALKDAPEVSKVCAVQNRRIYAAQMIECDLMTAE